MKAIQDEAEVHKTCKKCIWFSDNIINNVVSQMHLYTCISIDLDVVFAASALVYIVMFIHYIF